MILSIIFFVGWDVWHAASTVRNSYSQPNEPSGAYMIHMFESGNYAEQKMCSALGDCVLFRTQMSMFKVGYIEIAGTKYSQTANTTITGSPAARGIYCPGEIGIQSCFEIVVFKPSTTCLNSVTYLGYLAPLVPNSCLVEK